MFVLLGEVVVGKVRVAVSQEGRLGVPRKFASNFKAANHLANHHDKSQPASARRQSNIRHTQSTTQSDNSTSHPPYRDGQGCGGMPPLAIKALHRLRRNLQHSHPPPLPLPHLMTEIPVSPQAADCDRGSELFIGRRTR